MPKMIPSTFARGARVRAPAIPEAAKSISAEMPLSLGECLYVIMDLRRTRYPNVTKEQLLNMMSTAWDAYDEAASALLGKLKS